MKRVIRLFKIGVAGLGLWVLCRLAYFYCSALWEAVAYSAYGYYDPTAFVLVGLYLLPSALLVLHYGAGYVRKASSNR